MINDKASSRQFGSKYLNELKSLVLQLSLSQQKVFTVFPDTNIDWLHEIALSLAKHT